VNDLFEHVIEDVGSSDMVGITIQNQVNQNVKSIGISLGWKDKLSRDVLWSVFEKVFQSNSRFDALETMVVRVNLVKIPVGFGRWMQTMGRPISVMAHFKKIIMEVKAVDNCWPTP